MNKQLLDILVCPLSHRPLRLLAGSELKALEAAIAAGAIRDVGGEPVAKAPSEALISDDGATIYRVDDGIPVLLPESGIAAAGIANFAVG